MKPRRGFTPVAANEKTGVGEAGIYLDILILWYYDIINSIELNGGL
jgi:hypothetical protein